MTRHSRYALLSIATVLLLSSAPALADAPKPLGAFKDWAAFASGDGAAKMCFASAQPKTTLPAKAKRDPIYVFVTDWVGRKAKAEPEVVPGYPYKDKSSVTAQIGGQTFTFFTRTDADGGEAWMQDATEEAKLVAAMRAGSSMVVKGTSKRGTLTTDTYSLAGFGDALDKAHAECAM